MGNKNKRRKKKREKKLVNNKEKGRGEASDSTLEVK